jgi:hypothetical protein
MAVIRPVAGLAGLVIGAAVALGGAAIAATAAGAVPKAPAYSLAATQSCLTALPNTVVGLPPATPPVPPTLFVYALKGHDISTSEGLGPRPRAHRQLGVWYGGKRYQGIILSFFKSASEARASAKTLAWLYGGMLAWNVVVTWDQKQVPSGNVRTTVLGCLRSHLAGAPTTPRTPPTSTLATFAGRWGGHTRGLSITSAGRGQESADAGCCTRVYELGLQIISVKGALTRATAVYRVTSYRRYDSETRKLRVGELGRLILKNGIVTNTLTDDFFCSGPAWGATGACGA